MTLEAEDLLKIVLLLVIVWIGLEIIGAFIEFIAGPFSSIIGLLIVIVIVLYLLDRI